MSVNIQVSSTPYSIGYTDFNTALPSNVAVASLINKAGNTITASASSVAYALMEKGGILSDRYTAVLADGASANCWPIAGYSYFVIRTNSHIGSCQQRKAAMQFLYDFYFSTAVEQEAYSLGFSTLTNFIRTLVVQRLVNVAKCSNGEYALSQYLSTELSVVSSIAFTAPLRTYLSAYYLLDSSTVWQLSDSDESSVVWAQYIENPLGVTCAFTTFMSRAEKAAHYSNVSKDVSILTTAFASLPVASLYHLNAFTAFASGALRVTAEILAGIYTGNITHWDDPIIKRANRRNQMFLPCNEIIVVYRRGPSDVNKILSRYLAKKSIAFRRAYNVSGEDGVSVLPVDRYVPAKRLMVATSNFLVDSYVTFHDSSVGYYSLEGSFLSNIADFCPNPDCTVTINPLSSGALTACTEDPNTRFELGNIASYDLMFSRNTNACYPLVATVDYSVVLTNNVSSCLDGEVGVARQRVKFGQWLFSGDKLTQPLQQVYMIGSPDTDRETARAIICNITCGGLALGYDYCGYRDCSWVAGDYIQRVSQCFSSSEKRRVSYVLTSGNTCRYNPGVSPIESLYISCDYVMPLSGTALFCYAACAVGVAIALSFLLVAIYFRNERKFKRSQPAYVYLFLLGAIWLNLTAFVFVGPVSNLICTMRFWLYNLAFTITYGPLTLKMDAVDRIHGQLMSRLTTIKVSTRRIFYEMLGLFLVNIIILVLWTIEEPPKATEVSKTYAGVYHNVTNRICSNGGNIEVVMIGFHFCLLGFGIFRCFNIWTLPSDMNESKQFAISLCLGGVAYLMNLLVDYYDYPASLRSFAVIISGTVSVLIIVIPKVRTRKHNALRTSRRGHSSNLGRPPAARRVSMNSVRSGVAERKDSELANFRRPSELEREYVHEDNEMSVFNLGDQLKDAILSARRRSSRRESRAIDAQDVQSSRQPRAEDEQDRPLFAAEELSREVMPLPASLHGMLCDDMAGGKSEIMELRALPTDLGHQGVSSRSSTSRNPLTSRISDMLNVAMNKTSRSSRAAEDLIWRQEFPSRRNSSRLVEDIFERPDNPSHHGSIFGEDILFPTRELDSTADRKQGDNARLRARYNGSHLL